ncbi:MAG: peptidase T [Dysosmobacter sp.]
MDTVVDRLVRYAKIYSESDYYGQPGTPSAQREFDMANLLVEELHGLGIDNAFVDEHCYVYAWVPATPGYEHLPAIGLIAHMDTTPDMTGKDVKPQILHYDGGDLVLNREQNIVMEAARFPELTKFVGQDLVCSDGTTLLGADDKAGIAIILQAVEELLAEGTPHGKLCLGFTPDEEIGRGASNFDVAGFGADFAYTLDGGDITDYEYETFNAAMAAVTVHGFSIHPGTAKDKMKNALLIAMEFNALLPALETPGRTEGYEGFFHLQEMSGKVEEARMVYIIRDHSMERFQERKAGLPKGRGGDEPPLRRRHGGRQGGGPVLQHVRGPQGPDGDRHAGGGGHEGRRHRPAHPLPHPGRHRRVHADLQGTACAPISPAAGTMPTAGLSSRRWNPSRPACGQ